MPEAGSIASIRRRFEEPRRDHPVEPARMRVHAIPCVDGEIDDRERGGGKFLAQPLARVAVAARRDLIAEALEARIVTDHEQALDIRPYAPDKVREDPRIVLINLGLV